VRSMLCIGSRESEETVASETAYLQGWKEIAHYLKTSVRTVQRWERLSMPIHRTGQLKNGSVVALRHEIDQWMLNSGAQAAAASIPDLEAPKPPQSAQPKQQR